MTTTRQARHKLFTIIGARERQADILRQRLFDVVEQDAPLPQEFHLPFLVATGELTQDEADERDQSASYL